MEYAGAACELMRLLSVTDVKCKKPRKCQGWAQLRDAFFFLYFCGTFILPTTRRNKVIQML